MTSPRGISSLLGLAALGAALLGPATARAHFVLQSPPAAHEQGPLGDPQKAPPCGDDGSAVPTGIVSALQGGDKLTITIDETIFHPGHYRIALAVNDVSELPAEPPVTPGDTPCGSAPIDPAPQFPVLADGVFVHTEPFAEPQAIEVTLPDVTCDHCTLQVIQFMSNHGLNNPGGCYYHHCATISIQGTNGDTTGGTTGATTSATGTSADTDVTTTAASGSATGGDTGGVDTSAGGTSAGGTSAGGGDSTGAGTDSTSSGSTTDDGGCGCTSAGDQGLAGLLGLLGLLGLRPRRARTRA